MSLRRTVGSFVMGPMDDKSVWLEWEDFIVTTNPDGSHTAQTMTRFPGGSIVRHVTQTVDSKFMPLEGYSRLFVEKDYQGSLIRRVVGDKVTSLLLSPSGAPIDEATLPGGPDLVLGYHPTTVEGWKFTHCNKAVSGTQKLRILTTSATWNGGQMTHGKEVTLSIEYLGKEDVKTGAGTFPCDHYLWHTGAIDADIEVWTTGHDRICVKVLQHSKRVVFELDSYHVKEFGDRKEFEY